MEGTVIDSKGNKATGKFARDCSGTEITIIEKKSQVTYIGEVICYTLKHGIGKYLGKNPEDDPI